MAIGFEFQTNWTVKREPGGHNFPKETVLAGSRRGRPGFCMETDGGDVEFVVEPPIEESPAGRAKLIQVMDHMTHKIAWMDRENGPLSRRTHPRQFPLAPQDAVIRPNGARPTVAQPQITVGVRLGRIQEFVREIARIGLLAVNPNALFDRDGVGSGYFSRQYQRAATMASGAAPLPVGPGGALQPPSNKLKGLLTMTTQYLLGGAAAGASRHYAKDMAWAMARTDFAAMFNEISNAEKQYFQADPGRWVAYALRTAGLHTGNNTDAQAREFLLGAKVSDGGTLAEPARIPLTRGTWLADMARGVNPVDRFTEGGMQAPGMRDAGGTHRLRAPGMLGQRFDAVGRTRPDGSRHRGVVIELRQMRRNLPFTQWKQIALDVFDFTTQVNNRSDRAHDPAVHFTGVQVR